MHGHFLPSSFPEAGRATKSWETVPSRPARWCLARVHALLALLQALNSLGMGELSQPGKAYNAQKVAVLAINLTGRSKPCPDNLNLHRHPENPHIWPASTTTALAAGTGAEIRVFLRRELGECLFFSQKNDDSLTECLLLLLFLWETHCFD